MNYGFSKKRKNEYKKGDVASNYSSSRIGKEWTSSTSKLITRTWQNEKYYYGTSKDFAGWYANPSIWTTSQGQLGNTSPRSIAFGNNIWVMVGDSGQIRTSTDAITWVTRTSNTTAALFAVKHGNGIWLAAGNPPANQGLRRSTDSVTWTTTTSPFGASLTIQDLDFGVNIWVAAGNGGQIHTSSDNGATWTTRTSNFGNTIVQGVAYGNGLWVAVGNSGQIRRSTDAITWTTVTSNYTTTMTNVRYGNGVWLASAGNFSGSAQVLRSTDSITWTSHNVAVQGIPPTSIAYGDGLWIAKISNIVRVSTDAIRWQTQSSNLTVSAFDIAFGSNTFVIASTQPTRCLASSILPAYSVMLIPNPSNLDFTKNIKIS